jgi:nucleotide-binding universal stress UspA family protein
MIDHILIAVGEERMNVEAVAEHAAEVASALGADVTLFRVYGESEYEDILDGFEYDSADPADMAKRHSVVRDAAEILRDAGVELTVDAEVGPVPQRIDEYVEDHDIDHVYIGGRKRSPAGKVLMGSNSQDILLRLSVPVTVLFED